MALTTIDLTQTPKALVLALINRVNGCSLTETDVTFGVPTTVTADSDGRNTSLTVTATEESDYVTGDQVTVTYRRIPLSDLVSGLATSAYTFTIYGTTNISDILESINTVFGINLTTDDFVDAQIAAGTAKDTVEFTLAAADGSLVYQDSVTLYAYYSAAKLSDIITDTVLDGFVYK